MVRFPVLVLAVGMVALWTAPVGAYPMYENTGSPGTDDCVQCHGGFLASPYRRCDGGANNGALCTATSECPTGTCGDWSRCDGGTNAGNPCTATSACPGGACSRSLHDVHRNRMLGPASADPENFRCNICHRVENETLVFSPVFVNESNGTTGFDPISCLGCHGRQGDRGTRPADCVDAPTTAGPCGDGAGLRLHHQGRGVTVCGSCHTRDSDPMTFTPVGEQVLPPYYFTPDLLHLLKPTNSCNPNGEEDSAGSPDGLDNDGDLLYDLADPDCPTPTPTLSPTPTATVTPTATPTPTVIPTPNQDSQKCQAAIVKNAAAFVQAKAKALQKCEDGIVKRKITGPCPDTKAAEAIGKAGDKLATGIAKACGGKDKTCEAEGDDVPLSVIAWPGTCPNFEGKACANTINDCSGIATCVECIGEAAVDQAIGLYYGALEPTDPKSKDKREKSLNGCQGAIGKAGAAFLTAQSKALQRCWDAKSKGKVNECPDLKVGDAVSQAALKLANSINKACAGKDKQPGGDDVNADFLPTEIGFPATCMDVTFPGFITPCGGVITDLQSLTSCVACVTRFKAGCADRAGAIGLVPTYPSECNP